MDRRMGASLVAFMGMGTKVDFQGHAVNIVSVVVLLLFLFWPQFCLVFLTVVQLCALFLSAILF